MADKSFSKNIIDNVKKLLKKRKIKRFYMEELNEGKSHIAMILDSFFIRFFITIIFFVYMYFLTNDMLFAIAITIQVFILLNLLIYKINKMRFIKNVKAINERLAKNKIKKDFLNKTPVEFVEEMKDILEKCGINDLKLKYEKDLDIIGKFQGNTVGIKCFQYEDDYKVTVNEIRDFFLSLRTLEIDQGIVITTSSFSEDVKDFLPKLEKYTKLYLFNLDGLIKLLKKANSYPTKKEIDSMILNKVADKKTKIKEYREVVLSKGKTFKYFMVGILILIWGRITPYELYYRIAAYVLFFLGIISIGKFIITYLLEESTNIEEDSLF
ncbi:restriction endonuclease [Thermohalobacter berrensis]|uniref:Restriction endonuclease type IV Mrr domain-containing protein n=1 Tax=Thermohalobacter berrensis TaxID=99594 RepID=A0A419T9W9_9FIRM|nr:restriction endonuclease [Thermohalobacter berrensis]RKD34271.1 hypothetical protein BET03_00105 [Thermohalobacter berrensis]